MAKAARGQAKKREEIGPERTLKMYTQNTMYFMYIIRLHYTACPDSLFIFGAEF